MLLKSKIHQHCRDLIRGRILETETGIREIRLEAEMNAKSSAGDQYETARSMADLEIEKYQKTLYNLLQMNSALSRIDPETHNQEIIPGALICTDKGMIYLAVGLGKISIDDQDVLVISMGAPIVAVLRNTQVGGKAVFNGMSYQIFSIN